MLPTPIIETEQSRAIVRECTPFESVNQSDELIVLRFSTDTVGRGTVGNEFT